MSAVIDAPPTGSREWLEWRRGGLGASDLPTILALNPYQTEHELWLVKTGQAVPFAGNARTRWGHRLERIGYDEWKLAHPGWVVTGNDAAYRHPDYPHLWATPDAVALTSIEGPVGIEVKLTDSWTEPPDHVRVQALAQAGICQFSRVDVVRLNFDDDPAIFRIERDEASIDSILAAGEAWYIRHVIEGAEPPQRADAVEADERQVGLASSLRDVRRAIERLEKTEAVIKADIVASVAGRGVITGPGFRIEVRAAHEQRKTSWKDVAADHRQRLAEVGIEASELDAIEREYQTVSRVRPSVYPTWQEEAR